MPPTLTCGRVQIRTLQVIRPSRTPSRRRLVNIMRRTAGGGGVSPPVVIGWGGARFREERSVRECSSGRCGRGRRADGCRGAGGRGARARAAAGGGRGRRPRGRLRGGGGGSSVGSERRLAPGEGAFPQHDQAATVELRTVGKGGVTSRPPCARFERLRHRASEITRVAPTGDLVGEGLGSGDAAREAKR